jgi:hypothetical protein
LTTASDGKKYKVEFYSLTMILAIGLECEVKSDSGLLKV